MHIDSHHVLKYDAFKRGSFILQSFKGGTSKTRRLRLSFFLSPPKKSEIAKYILNLKMNLEYWFFEFAKDAVQKLGGVEILIKMGGWGEKLFERYFIEKWKWVCQNIQPCCHRHLPHLRLDFITLSWNGVTPCKLERTSKGTTNTREFGNKDWTIMLTNNQRIWTK